MQTGQRPLAGVWIPTDRKVCLGTEHSWESDGIPGIAVCCEACPLIRTSN